MCIELPCGYSSQTLTKIIAYCKITIYACLISAIAIFALFLECHNAEVRRKQGFAESEWSGYMSTIINNDAISSPEPVTEFNLTTPSSAETESSFTTDVTTTEDSVLEIVKAENAEETIEHDLMKFMEMSHPIIRALFILWIIVNVITGLICSIILLQGAQERNLFKVKTWFFVTVTSYLLWIPIYAYWASQALDPVSILMSGFMTYMLGGLCLWIVSGFIEELRIESISHRAGYKDMLVPFYKV